MSAVSFVVYIARVCQVVKTAKPIGRRWHCRCPHNANICRGISLQRLITLLECVYVSVGLISYIYFENYSCIWLFNLVLQRSLFKKTNHGRGELFERDALTNHSCIVLYCGVMQACQTCDPRAACGPLQAHLRPAQRIL